MRLIDLLALSGSWERIARPYSAIVGQLLHDAVDKRLHRSFPAAPSALMRSFFIVHHRCGGQVTSVRGQA